MLRAWKAPVLGILALLCLSPIQTAWAEKITLTNGDVVEGQIISQSERTVTIKTATQTLALPRARIQSIDQGAPGSAQLLQATEALRKGDLKGARACCEQAASAGAAPAQIDPIRLQIQKREAEMELARYSELIKQARESAAKGQDSEALQQITELLKTLPAESSARKEIISIICDFHLSRVAEHRDKVRNELAIQELNRVIELDPNRPMAYAELGEIYTMSSGTWPDAITSYDTALRLAGTTFDDQKKASISWEVGEILRQQSKWKDAIDRYLIAHQIYPSVNPRLVDQLVEVTRRYAEDAQGRDNSGALATVDKTLAIRETPELLLLRGNLLRRLLRYDESNASFEKVAAKNPRTRNLFYSMAQNHLSKGDLLAARDLLLREVELFQNNYDALCELGDLALNRDDYEQAEDYYGKAVAIDADKPRASLGLGKAYRQRGELPKARSSVQEVLARLPDNREANLEMGKIYRDENNLDEASRFFTQVLDLIEKADVKDQDDLKALKADALIARGELALLTTGPGTASIDFRKALDVLPDYSQAFYSIGMAYRKKFASSKRIEDLKTAEENLLKARELAKQNPQFALEIGILYQQQLAQADSANEKDYLAKAVTNYRDYIQLGGANAPQVETWIKEIEAK